MDLNLFKASRNIALEYPKQMNGGQETGNDTNGESDKDGLADEDANLMIKLKFLTYKVSDSFALNCLAA